MGYKCCVPECTVGCISNPKPKDVYLFSFPNEGTPTRAVWIKIIKGITENWTVSNSARVCSNHFRPEDFGKVSVDRRGRTTANSILSKKISKSNQISKITSSIRFKLPSRLYHVYIIHFPRFLLIFSLFTATSH